MRGRDPVSRGGDSSTERGETYCDIDGLQNIKQHAWVRTYRYVVGAWLPKRPKQERE